MKHFLLILSSFLAILLAGCTTTIGERKDTSASPSDTGRNINKTTDSVETKPSQNTGRIEKSISSKGEAERDSVNNGVKKTVPGKETTQKAKNTLIIIGNTLALRASDETISHKRYDAYEKSLRAAKMPVKMKRDWFVANSAGYAAIKYWEVSGVMSKRMYAEVSKEIRKKMDFPPEIMASTLGASTDLVAAEQREGRGIWITRVLCKKKAKNFDECSGKYAKGLFRQSDGKEVDANLKPVKNGAQIDLVSFEAIGKKSRLKAIGF
jgi:hypothetical protein